MKIDLAGFLIWLGLLLAVKAHIGKLLHILGYLQSWLLVQEKHLIAGFHC